MSIPNETQTHSAAIKKNVDDMRPRSARARYDDENMRKIAGAKAMRSSTAEMSEAVYLHTT